MNAKALWYLDAGKAEIREHQLEAPARNQVQVRARFGALSRGTESLVFHRRIPPSEFERMRAPFQWGTLPDAISYGYVSVGEVESGDPEREGEGVFCLHPHHTRYTVPGEAAHPIPAQVPLERAILAANLETALNALWDGEVLAGHRVQVRGAGVVGCLIARLARRIPGVDVEIVDPNPERQRVASALSLEFATPDTASSDWDRVFECSGRPKAAAQALSALKTEGSLVVVSWYGESPVTLPLGADFHSRRLKIVCSQVGRVSPKMGHFTFTDRLRLALKLLDDPPLDVLVSEEVAFDELPAALPHLFSPAYRGLCTRILY
ncbi:MAG: zinc-binding alcohol dehydrogenase [Myxococcota bacterium]